MIDGITRVSVSGNYLIGLAAFVVVVAGMRQATDILVPFLLSGFIAIIAAPPMFWLKAQRIPTGVALLLVLAAIVGMGGLLGGLVGQSVNDFSSQLPFYRTRLNEQMEGTLHWLSQWGFTVSEDAISTLLNPGAAMDMVAQGLTSLGGLLTNTFLILITVAFILLEASSFPNKLRAILPHPEASVPQMARVVLDIKRYMALKAATSLLTGVLVGAWLWIIGVDYPVLWGVLAFLLNFVPNIGAIIAGVPPVLLAWIQLDLSGAIWTLAGYGAINGVIGSAIEPRLMGQKLGLSTLVVFLSLVFWGWVLGVVGMFLSVPLTMTLKIILDGRDETRWIAVLLGPDIGTQPAAPRIGTPP